MKKHKEYDIPFTGLKQGKHRFDYNIENKFFESFDYNEYNAASIDLQVILNKLPTVMELVFSSTGWVNVNCDVTDEPYNQPIAGNMELLVKFGEEFNDDNDEILIIPYGEHQINIAQYIYEMLVLSVPQKRVHPGVLDGSLKSKAIERLQELQPKELKENKKNTDPRWDALKKLLTDK